MKVRGRSESLFKFHLTRAARTHPLHLHPYTALVAEHLQKPWMDTAQRTAAKHLKPCPPRAKEVNQRTQPTSLGLQLETAARSRWLGEGKKRVSIHNFSVHLSTSSSFYFWALPSHFGLLSVQGTFGSASSWACPVPLRTHTNLL